MMWQEIKNEVSNIYSDLENDGVIPSYENWQMLVHSDTVQNLIGGYSKLWSKYAELKQHLRSVVSNALRKAQSEFDDITQIITEGRFIIMKYLYYKLL